MGETVFKYYMGQSIQKNGPNKICGRQPLKNLKWHGLLFKSKKLITLKITFALIERDCVPQQQIDKKSDIDMV